MGHPAFQSDDAPPPPPTREEVMLRLEDWKNRLNDLYRLVRETAEAEPTVSIETAGVRSMNEPPMKLYGLPPVEWPVLLLRKSGEPIFRIWPEALWVIGANGRVMVDGRFANYRRFIDIAEPMAPPQWVMLDKKTYRQGGRPVDAALIRELLGETE